MYSLSQPAINKYLPVVLIPAVLTSVALYNPLLLLAAALLLLVLFIFLKMPELPLAVIFNGTLLYFYMVYRLGMQTSRPLTAGFYGLLVYTFLTAGLLLLIKGHRRFYLSIVDILFSAFFLLIFLSYIAFSTENYNAYVKAAYAPVLAIAPYFGARMLFSETRIRNFLKYSIMIAVLLMIPAFYELFNNPALGQRIRYSMFIFTNLSNVDDPMRLGNTYAILIIIVLIWQLEKHRFKIRHLILIGLSSYLVLLSGSRGIIVSLAVSLVFYFLFLSRLRPAKRIFTITALILLFSSNYYLLPNKLAKFYQYSVTARARQESTSSIQMRMSMWKQAIHDFKEHPVLGMGIGNSDNGSGRPHNIILELAVELGIPGLFIFTLLCCAVITKAMYFIRDIEFSESNILMKIALIIFIHSLTHTMFSGIITDQIRLFISMGLIVCLDNIRLTNTYSLNKCYS